APEKPALPVIAIPTTAGTGTEADPWTVITKSGAKEKIGYGNDSTYPALSIVDPELMLSVPPRMTAYTGMDAFFHAVESFLNLNRQPANDMLALEAVHLITHYLPELVADPGNLELRTIQAWASTAAGICESIGGCISHHSLEHALSAMNTDLVHGAGLVMLSVPYFTKLAELAPEHFEDLATAMGFEDVEEMPLEERPKAFLAGLADLIKEIGLADEKLSDHGFTQDNVTELTDIAFGTMGGLFPVTPGNMTRKDVEEIFSKAIG
ncbi:MAG: iron-containing alcohol dehydrogenase, partial [Proteobacteria bacterium]|nr:iron-containing alcohol dehydrogenase [Pseudomonadota bacterium]